jgi:hypothetical protein
MAARDLAGGRRVRRRRHRPQRGHGLVFNRTGESLPLAMLLHVSVNTYFSVAWSSMFPTIATRENGMHVQLLTFTVGAFMVLIATRGRLGYRPAVEHSMRDAA